MPNELKDFDIVGSYNDQIVPGIDAERTVNMFEYIDVLGKKPKALIGTSGLLNPNLTSPGARGGFRGQFVFNADEYHVIGNSVYKYSANGIISLLGTINTLVGLARIDANTFQIIFVDGSNGYIWDTVANIFTPITDTSFPKFPVDVTYLDGFFVVASGNTNTFQLSQFNQGLVWGPDSQVFMADFANNWLILTNTANYQTGVSFTLSTTGTLPAPLNNSTTYYAINIDSTHIQVANSYQNATANNPIILTSNGTPISTITSTGALQQGAITTHPGNIVACRTLHRRLFLFSTYYCEVWENAGIGTNLPFRRNNSLLIEYGTPCIGSIVVSFDIMIFQAQAKDGLGSVMMVSGTQPIPISNHALDRQLSNYIAANQMSDCRAFLVRENSMIFYRMNFTAANHTWVYNVTLSDPSRDETKKWHEEETLAGNRHPAQTIAYFNGQNYVGDYANPIMYILDPNTYTNNGENIKRMRISRSFVPPGYNRIRVDRFHLDLLQGNIAEANDFISDINLLAENGDPILTEDGINIILDQQFIIADPMIPFVFFSASKDGGQTYKYTVKSPMGAIGNRTARTVWRKLGATKRGQPFLTKIEFYAAIPYIILGAAWSFEVLPQ